MKFGEDFPKEVKPKERVKIEHIIENRTGYPKGLLIKLKEKIED